MPYDVDTLPPVNYALSDVCAAYSAFRPPKRVTVAEGAADVLYIRQPGGYSGFWSASEAPYMIEPMNTLASRVHEAVCFVGPARTGKTMGLLDAWFAHTVICDPGDMLIVQMTQDKARDYSKTRIDRAIRDSPKLGAQKTGRGSDDNTHDKMFKNGMWVKIGWPTISQLSGSDYRYVGLTDYDRMPDDIDGEGSGFELGKKRTTTFMSRGMCMVESSPGRDIEDPNWKPASPHEAPPVGGVLGIYNLSDRARWHWPCPHCGEYFEARPGLGLFNLPPDKFLLEQVRGADLKKMAAEYARISCPNNGCVIEYEHKFNMNQKGRWVCEGQHVTEDGTVVGERVSASIAGYWLGGVAAAYQSWHSLVQRQLQGLREYALTGGELVLQTTANTDQGIPYTSRLLMTAQQGTGEPEGRKEDFPRFVVPGAARCLVASVDIQSGERARFEVQVHAVGVDLEQWIVDRFAITESRRPGMGAEFAPLDPAAYPEDWDRLTELVTQATYRLEQEGKELRIKMVAVDTGGEDGVTANAYAWYRRLRAEGKHGNVMLVKGASTKAASILRQTVVGAQNKEVKGDIPLYLLNTNLLKDMVMTSLSRPDVGATYMHFPSWLPASFFEEYKAEIRRVDGTYTKISSRSRNESLDLSAYIRAACLRLGIDKISWEAPPSWALPLDKNTDVISSEERRRLQKEAGTTPSRSSRSARRVSASSYMT